MKYDNFSVLYKIEKPEKCFAKSVYLTLFENGGKESFPCVP